MKRIIATALVFLLYSGAALAQLGNESFALHRYKPKRGDCLIKLAKRFELNTYQIIAKLNGLKCPYTIFIGKPIWVPVKTEIRQIAEQGETNKSAIATLNEELSKNNKEISRLEARIKDYDDRQTFLLVWCAVLTMVALAAVVILIFLTSPKIKVDKRYKKIKTAIQLPPGSDEAQVKFAVNDIGYTCTLPRNGGGKVGTLNPINNNWQWVSDEVAARRSVKSTLRQYLNLKLLKEKAVLVERAIEEGKLTRDE